MIALSSYKLKILQLPQCLYLRLSCWYYTDKESAGNKRKAWSPNVPVMKIICMMFDNVSVAIIFFFPDLLIFCFGMHELGQITENLFRSKVWGMGLLFRFQYQLEACRHHFYEAWHIKFWLHSRQVILLHWLFTRLMCISASILHFCFVIKKRRL